MGFAGSDWWEVILDLGLFLLPSFFGLGLLSLDLFCQLSLFFSAFLFCHSLEQFFPVFQFLDFSVYLLNRGGSNDFDSFEKSLNVVWNTELFRLFSLFVLLVLFLVLFLRFFIILALLRLENLKSFFLFPLSISSQLGTDFGLIDLHFLLLFNFFLALLESIEIVDEKVDSFDLSNKFLHLFFLFKLFFSSFVLCLSWLPFLFIDLSLLDSLLPFDKINKLFLLPVLILLCMELIP